MEKGRADFGGGGLIMDGCCSLVPCSAQAVMVFWPSAVCQPDVVMVLMLGMAEMDADRMYLEFFTPQSVHLPHLILIVNGFTPGKVNWNMLVIVRVACLVMALVIKPRTWLSPVHAQSLTVWALSLVLTKQGQE